MNGKRSFFKKTDVLVMLAIIAAGLAVWVYQHFTRGDAAVRAEIYYYRELVEVIELVPGVESTFSVPQEPNVIFKQHADGTISFVESDCPDKVCINTGKIGLAGQTAACLPNGLVVKIVPSERTDDEVDIITG